VYRPTFPGPGGRLTNVSYLLLALGGALVAAFLADVLARRSGLPDVVILITLGLLLGPLLHITTEGTLLGVAPYVGLAALALILFDAGLDLRRHELGGLPAVAAAFAGLSVTVSFLAIFPLAYFFLVGRSVPLALLFAGALSCTSSAVVVPIAARMRLPPGARATVNVSSALEDTLAIILVTTLLVFYSPGHNGILLVLSTALQIPLGLAGGFLAGMLWIVVARRYQSLPFFSMATVGFLIFLAGFVDALGGSGILAALVFGVTLGNARSLEKVFRIQGALNLLPTVRQFQTEMAFLLRAFFLLLLGMLFEVGPDYLEVLALGATMGGVLIGMRYLTVAASVERGVFPAPWRVPLSTLGTRGLTSAVLVVLPVTYGLVPSAQNFLDPTLVVVLVFTVYTALGVFFHQRRTSVAGTREAAAPASQGGLPTPTADQWESMWGFLSSSPSAAPSGPEEADPHVPPAPPPPSVGPPPLP
jgi:cell volume regulation protein A